MEMKKVLCPNLDDNLKALIECFKDCPDVLTKNLMLRNSKKACCMYINGFVNKDLLQRDLIMPLLTLDSGFVQNEKIIDYLPILNITSSSDFDTVKKAVLSGKAIVLIEGLSFAICCDLTSPEKRSISEPETEKNIRGAHDGFIEAFEPNITILRQRIKDNRLKFKNLVLGNITKQRLAVAYIDGIANPEILNNLYNKISRIDIDGLSAVGSVEHFITDSKYSLFPQYMSTERPDKAVASLLEGRFVVILEGTPRVLIAPVSFFSYFQATDDYSSKWDYGTFTRIIRFLGMILAIYLPALYISTTSFEYYLIPINLLIPLARSRVQVAFPPIIEAIVMELTIEMLREASIRLPSYVAITIGVVGGIIIGQAAVNAGVVSNLFIIVIAVTTIATYLTPVNDFGLSVRLVRLVFLSAAAVFGIIGIEVASVFLVAHILSLESLGQPYFIPIIPFHIDDLKDTIIRLPIEFFKKRPHIAKPLKKKRGSKNGG